MAPMNQAFTRFIRKDSYLLTSLLLVLGACFFRVFYGSGFLISENPNLLHYPSFWIPSFLEEVILANEYSLHWFLKINLLVIGLGFWAILKKRHSLATTCVWITLLSRIFLYGANILSWEVFDHAFIIFSLCALITHDRKLAIKCSFSLIYLLSGLTKINPSWLSADTFSLLPNQYLSFIPHDRSLFLFCCWFLFFIEMATPLLIFSKYKKFIGYFWIAFHTYTAFFLGFSFPLLMLTLWFLNFEAFNNVGDKKSSFKKLNYSAIGFIAITILWSQYHLLIPGPRSVTGEWKQTGLFMFDSNPMCEINVELKDATNHYNLVHRIGYRDGVVTPSGKILQRFDELSFFKNKQKQVLTSSSKVSLNDKILYNRKLAANKSLRTLCNPYVVFQYLKIIEERFEKFKIVLSSTIFLNGYEDGFKFIELNSEQIKTLNFSHFSHNEWIKYPKSHQQAVFLWP